MSGLLVLTRKEELSEGGKRERERESGKAEISVNMGITSPLP